MNEHSRQGQFILFLKESSVCESGHSESFFLVFG